MKSFVPREYQHLIVDHIIKTPRCAIWAGMGLGKTGGTLSALNTLSLVEPVYPALILAPLRVARSTWKDEGAKWTDFRHIGISPVVGTAEERLSALRQPADIYCLNYENLPWLEETLGDTWQFRTVVADEATKLKNTRSKQGGTRAAALRRYAFTKVKRFIELTGSPSPNGLRDLYGQIYMLDRGQRLGTTYEAFESRWFAYKRIKDAVSHKTHVQTFIMPFAQEQIQERIKDICLSLNAADYFDIREPIIVPVYVDLPPTARKLYSDMEKKMFMQIEHHEIEAFNAGAKSQKLSQLAAGAAYVEPDVDSDDNPKSKDWKVVHDEKIEALEDIIGEANGMPMIVAYHFKSDLARLKKAFPKGRHLKTKQDEDDFKAGKIDLLFLHPASAAHGIDGFQYITNIIAFFGMSWDLELYLQVIERIGPVRQIQAGFNRNVFIYNIIARNTVDEDMVERRKSKKSVQDILLEAMKRRKYI